MPATARLKIPSVSLDTPILSDFEDAEPDKRLPVSHDRALFIPKILFW